MAKITINGEVFAWDRTVRPLADALFVERVLNCNYAAWESEFVKKLNEGHHGTLAMVLALALRRAGHTVTVEDARNGTFEVGGRPVDLNEVGFDADEEDGNPTSPPPEDSKPTGGGTSASSPKDSA